MRLDGITVHPVGKCVGDFVEQRVEDVVLGGLRVLNVVARHFNNVLAEVAQRNRGLGCSNAKPVVRDVVNLEECQGKFMHHVER